MASAQEPGLVTIFIEEPTGTRHRVLKMRVEQTGPSGAADHVVQSTPEKWQPVPRTGGAIGRGWKMIVCHTADAADGVDVSDCVASIPVTDLTTGKVEHIADGDMTAVADYTAVAGALTTVWTYEFAGGPKQFGGGKIFVAIEDDTG